MAVVAACLIAPEAGAAGTPTTAALQVSLRAKGIYRGTVDGIAGPQTETALRLFQLRAGLLPDGVPGPETLQAFGALGRPALGTRTLSPGMRGWDVAALQFELESHGFPVGDVDGEYGARTVTAVREFEAFAGLPADGIAGGTTLVALQAPPVTAPLMRSPVAVAPGLAYGPQGDSFHTGVDFPAAAGTAVTAAAAGEVVRSSHDGADGNYIVIDHGDGVRTAYALLLSRAVTAGTMVSAGELIGRVGPSLRSGAPRLHYEVSVRGAYAAPRFS